MTAQEVHADATEAARAVRVAKWIRDGRTDTWERLGDALRSAGFETPKYPYTYTAAIIMGGHA